MCSLSGRTSKTGAGGPGSTAHGYEMTGTGVSSDQFGLHASEFTHLMLLSSLMLIGPVVPPDNTSTLVSQSPSP